MRLLLCVAALLLSVVSAKAESVSDPAQYTWKSRVLLVFSSSADDPDLAAQRRIVADEAAGMKDRDLVLVARSTPADSEDRALRRRYGVNGAGFEALLIGKDGGVKLKSARPIEAQRLFQTIDAMPMRRSEAAGRS